MYCLTGYLEIYHWDSNLCHIYEAKGGADFSYAKPLVRQNYTWLALLCTVFVTFCGLHVVAANRQKAALLGLRVLSHVQTC